MDEEKILKILSVIKDYRFVDDVTEHSVFNEEYFGYTKPEYNGLIEYLYDEGFVTGFIRLPIMSQSFKTYKPNKPKLTVFGDEYLKQNK